MVRRLIQQQCLRMSEQCLRQQHAHFLPALQLAHLPFVQLVGYVKTLQQDCGIGFGGIAVFFADNAFQLTQPHPVFVGELGFLIDGVALLQGSPQALVAHHDGVNHAKHVERKLVLVQHAEFLRTYYGPLLRIEFSGQELHECGFARLHWDQ